MELEFSEVFDVEKTVSKSVICLKEFRLIIITNADERLTIINKKDTINVNFELLETSQSPKGFMRYINYNDKEKKVYSALKDVQEKISSEYANFLFRMYYLGIQKTRLKKMFKLKNNDEFDDIFIKAHYFFGLYYGFAVLKGEK